MKTVRKSGKERKLTEIMSYSVVVINPRRISIRNINHGVKTLLGKEIDLKVLTIQY